MHTRVREISAPLEVPPRGRRFSPRVCISLESVAKIRDHLQSSCRYKTCTDKRSETYPINMYESTVLIYNLIKNI